MTKISAIIAAGGSSTRFGNTNKLIEKINGKEVILYSIEKLLNLNEINELIIPSSADLKPILQDLLKDFNNIKIIQGGNTRQQSVYNALKAVNNPDFVLIHDGARPLISVETIKKAINKAKANKNAIVAVKTTDTIKQVAQNGLIEKTLARNCLYNVQTPQIFEYETILSAHQRYEGEDFSDDSLLLEQLNIPVYVVEGDYSNIKITTKNDIEFAESLL